jgi:hypothetical protein
MERARGAEPPFAASDFEFRVEAQRTTFTPGEVVVFDGILTNVSPATADFEINVALVGISFGPEIDGAPALTFPFIEGLQTGSFRNEHLPPGGSLRFPLIFIDTAPSTPLGTTILSGATNLLFQNIPPSTSDPNVDFFVSALSGASATSVPEGSSMLLLYIGVTGLVYGIPRECRCLPRSRTVNHIRHRA